MVKVFSLLHGSTDTLLWGNSEKRYTIKSQYAFLNFGGILVPKYTCLWKAGIPLKIRAFLWLVFHQKILTRDNLIRRGWIGTSLCPMCQQEDETAPHLFLRCSIASQLWEWIPSLTTSQFYLNSLEDLWASGEQLTGPVKRRFIALIRAVLWVIWGERNRVIFNLNVIPKSARSLSALVCSHFLLWTSSRVGDSIKLLEFSASDTEEE
jgi:zinc-binding in reverse transcriptase